MNNGIENVLHQIKNTFEYPSFFKIKELILQLRMIHTITSYATAHHTAMYGLVNLFKDDKQKVAKTRYACTTQIY